MATYLLQSATAAANMIERETVHVQLYGTTAAERKMSVLDAAGDAAIIGLSHGSGKVAKAAAERKHDIEMGTVAQAIANGDFQSFAVIVAGKLGEAVKFGHKDSNGDVVRKASDDFRKFGNVLEHKMLQLEDKGKVYTAAGKYTSAALDLQYLITVHGCAIRLMDAKKAADDKRRAELAERMQVAIQSEKGAEVVADVAVG